MAEDSKKNIQEQILDGGPVSPEIGVEKKPIEGERVVSDVVKKEQKKIDNNIVATPPGKLGDDISKKTNEKKIEEILEEDLEEVYFDMSDDKQREFKKRGEETVRNISLLMRETTIKVGKILKLITRWLKIIPGINKFFLEQEAKIKTDKILKLKK